MPNLDDASIAQLEGSLSVALAHALNGTVDHSVDPAVLAKREAAVERREADVGRREAAVERREAAVLEFERMLRRREAELGLSAVTGQPKKKAGRQADPMHDVPALVEAYQTTGGVVPLGVLVAEVEAVQQAATKLGGTAAGFETQCEQLRERLKADLPTWMEGSTQNQIKELNAQKEESTRAGVVLTTKLQSLKDRGIERFTPLLLQTVSKYDANFELALGLDGEACLERIAMLCKPLTATKGRTLRQHLPSAKPRESLETLLLLLDQAIQANEKLKQLALAAVSVLGDGDSALAEVIFAPKPTKGIVRAIQKVQEEYDSDYTRLLDYARITIVCETLGTLEALLAWFISAERDRIFRAVRAKDRLSRLWDAELSGGNRDVMLNGWIELGGGRSFIVEVQLHLRCLYELKSDLHVLYAGARVLGATEDSTCSHAGLLTMDALQRMRRGVVRKAEVPHSEVSAEVQEGLAAFLKQEPCPLLSLNLEFSTSKPPGGQKLAEGTLARPAFDGWTLSRLLEPSTGTLACRRLRNINIGPGLTGTIPDSLSQCVELHNLDLSHCGLSGPFPPWLDKLTKLECLYLKNNKLTGPIPGEILAKCKRLKYLYLQDNQFSGPLPTSALLGLIREGSLLHIDCGNTEIKDYTEQWSPWLLAIDRERGTTYEDGSANKALVIPDADVAALRDALVELTQDMSKEVKHLGMNLPLSCKSGKAAQGVVKKAVDGRGEKEKQAAAAGDS